MHPRRLPRRSLAALRKRLQKAGQKAACFKALPASQPCRKGSRKIASKQELSQSFHHTLQEAQEAHHQAQPAQETLAVKRGLRRQLNTQRRHAKHQHHTVGDLACNATNATVGHGPWMLCYTGISKKTKCSHVLNVYQPRIWILT